MAQLEYIISKNEVGFENKILKLNVVQHVPVLVHVQHKNNKNTMFSIST